MPIRRMSFVMSAIVAGGLAVTAAEATAGVTEAPTLVVPAAHSTSSNAGIPVDTDPDYRLCMARTALPGFCVRWDRDDVTNFYDFYVAGPGANVDKAVGAVCRIVPNGPGKALCKLAFKEKWSDLTNTLSLARQQGRCAEARVPFGPQVLLTKFDVIDC